MSSQHDTPPQQGIASQQSVSSPLQPQSNTSLQFSMSSQPQGISSQPNITSMSFQQKADMSSQLSPPSQSTLSSPSPSTPYPLSAQLQHEKYLIQSSESEQESNSVGDYNPWETDSDYLSWDNVQPLAESNQQGFVLPASPTAPPAVTIFGLHFPPPSL